jgi:hypothetical protein
MIATRRPVVQFPDSTIIVFCKAPEDGRVKTRLASALTDHVAATIHTYLARHVIERLVTAHLAEVELWCAPDTHHTFFRRCHEEWGIRLKTQCRGDLGQRMAQAFQDTLSRRQNALIVGTDCAVLDQEYIQQALLALNTGDHPVIGPAEDGGYVLLGLHGLPADLFSDMTWGSAGVFAETCRRLGEKSNILDTLWDVDRMDDLVRLRRESTRIPLANDFQVYLDALLS